MIASNTVTALLGGLSGAAALGMMVLAWITWKDKRDRDMKDAKLAEQLAEDKQDRLERIDLLAAGQTSIQAALERADAENTRLRGHLVILRREHEADVKGWQKKFEAQEDEIIDLQGQCQRCTEECALLRQQVEGKK